MTTEATVSEIAPFRARRAAALEGLPTTPAWTVPGGLPAPPPTGTVTFLLSDIEGSTPRWDANPDGMEAAVRRHYEILDAAVAAHAGVRPIEQGEGDSMVAAFSLASDAAAAAIQIQRALAAEPWPEGADVRVRMALHTGEARLRDQLYYVGPSIIRCARLRGLSHGGQILVSGATADLLADALPVAVELTELGSARLKGLREAERVFQLVHPELRATFPPLPAVDTLPTNLPPEVSSFVGRRAELAAIVDLMEHHRLVTLTGAGGTGKSRLAAQTGGELLTAYPNGVWWVELATVTDPEYVSRAVMTAIGLEGTHVDPVARLAGYLRGQRVLLVLDNCEHVLSPVADLAGALLLECPDLMVLATSREPFALGGEAVYAVPPMTTGDDAARLFAERAAEARPGFQVDATNAGVVAELCARLDGLPLAIELAAARVRALPLERILAGLTQRFALLTGGVRSRVPHQQTLEASMAWSHELLTPHQQVLFRRLAVFTGRFGLDDVEAVAAAEPLRTADCLVLLADLVDRSLVVFDGEHYRLLQTVGDYAADRLAEAEETDATRAAHLRRYAALAATAAAELDAAPLPQTLDRLEPARANLLAAVEYALSVGDHTAALRVTADLGLFWQMRSCYGEALAFVRKVLASTPEHSSRDRARVLWSAGQTGLFGMDIANGYGLPDTGRALEMAEAVAPDVVGRAQCVQHMVEALAAPALARESLAVARERSEAAGDRYGVGLATVWLALAATFGLDDAELTERELARLDAEARATGSSYWSIWHAICAGMRAQRAGRTSEAVALLERAVERGRAAGDSQLEFFAAWPLADAHADAGASPQVERVVAASVAWQDRSAMGRPEMMRLRRARMLLQDGAVDAARAELAATEAVIHSFGFDIAVVEWELLAARAAEHAGDAVAARTAVDIAARLAAGVGNPWYETWAAYGEGRVARLEGKIGGAEESLHRALARCVRHGYTVRAAAVLEALASLALAGESPVEATRLYGAADALRARQGTPRPALEAPGYDADQAALLATLGAQDVAAATAEGRALDLAAAAAYASRARGERRRPSAGWDSLTPTERSVVALIAEGLTNAAIAEHLFITTGTVKVHVRHIFAKLDISRRSELAARATERRLR